MCAHLCACVCVCGLSWAELNALHAPNENEWNKIETLLQSIKMARGDDGMGLPEAGAIWLLRSCCYHTPSTSSTHCHCIFSDFGYMCSIIAKAFSSGFLRSLGPVEGEKKEKKETWIKLHHLILLLCMNIPKHVRAVCDECATRYTLQLAQRTHIFLVSSYFCSR